MEINITEYAPKIFDQIRRIENVKEEEIFEYKFKIMILGL